jgi:hypothetical protein
MTRESLSEESGTAGRTARRPGPDVSRDQFVKALAVVAGAGLHDSEVAVATELVKESTKVGIGRVGHGGGEAYPVIKDRRSPPHGLAWELTIKDSSMGRG